MAPTDPDGPAPATKKLGRGGARPGAGRKPKVIDVSASIDSLEFFRRIMTSPTTPEPLRLRAAVELAKYEHERRGTQQAKGKKTLRQEAADEAVQSGRFKPGRAPLKAVK